MTPQQLIVQKLKDLVKDWNEHDDVPLDQQHDARALGKELDRLGGYPAMLDAYDEVHAHNKCAAVLQAYWDNIGTWRW